MTKGRGKMKMRMPKKNLPASGGNGGGKRCLMCERASLRSSDLCGRCSHLRRTDITRLLPRRLFLTYCSGCSCYLQPPNIHVRADPNSNVLLNYCIRCFLRRLNGLPIRYVNAEFVKSSDPDVIKVKVHLRGEISQGTIADRHHLTEFTVRHEICKSCSGSSISDPQQCVTRVELRQVHRRCRNTLIRLLKHGGTGRAINIREHDMGTDIVFSDRTHALDYVRFIEGLVPVKKQSDDDGVSATFFSLHIIPIRQNDLIRLPAAISGSLLGGVGNLGPLVICTEVAAHGISLMDPLTLRSAFLTAEDYWRAPFYVALDFRLMVEYLVLDIVMITPDPPPSKDAGDDSCCWVHAHIVRVSNLGKRDDHNKLMVRTHLGRLLKPGDYALGYDVGGAGDPAMKVILVKKVWQVKKKKTPSSGEPSSREPRSVDTGLDGIWKDEYEELLRELEENTRLGLINSSPHQTSKESQMLPTSSDGIPSNPDDKWLGDESAADNATMDWLPATQLSSHQQVPDT